MVLFRILFYLLNMRLYPETGYQEFLRFLLPGLRFDLSGTLLINAVYIGLNSLPFAFRYHRVYQAFANGFYFVANIMGFGFQAVDMARVRFLMERSTPENLSGVTFPELKSLLPHLIQDYWYLWLLWTAGSILFVLLALRFRAGKPGGKSRNRSVVRFSAETIAFLSISALVVIGIRGGLQARPLDVASAGSISTARNIPLLTNTPFTLLSSFYQKHNQYNYYRKEPELREHFNPVFRPPAGKMRNENVVVIAIEGLSLELVGAVNHRLEGGKYQGYTPFLDSLIGKGYYFPALSGGTTACQSLPAILSSLPPLHEECLMKSGVLTGAGSGIASLLGKQGYHSAFFQLGDRAFKGAGDYARIAGFASFYEGTLSKEADFLAFTYRKLNALPQPFVATMVYLTLHYPFEVPGKHRHVLRTGNNPASQAAMYSDLLLRRFFESVRHTRWFSRTLFVITGAGLSENHDPAYNQMPGCFMVPLVFFRPDGSMHGSSKVPVSQTDILPTVMTSMGYSSPFVTFGRNIFEAKPGSSYFYRLSGIFGMIRDGYCLEFNGSEVTGFYNLKTDPGMKSNIAHTGSGEMKKSLVYMKAYLQQYFQRTGENRLNVD